MDHLGRARERLSTGPVHLVEHGRIHHRPLDPATLVVRERVARCVASARSDRPDDGDRRSRRRRRSATCRSWHLRLVPASGGRMADELVLTAPGGWGEDGVARFLLDAGAASVKVTVVRRGHPPRMTPSLSPARPSGGRSEPPRLLRSGTRRVDSLIIDRAGCPDRCPVVLMVRSAWESVPRRPGSPPPRRSRGPTIERDLEREEKSRRKTQEAGTTESRRGVQLAAVVGVAASRRW